MPTTRRRSARLAGSSSASTPKRSLASYAVNKLSSLLERDETPKAHRSINQVMSPPSSKNNQKMPGSFETEETYLQTPQKPNMLVPGHEEMHPSKVHRSTTKTPDSGLRLGFSDIKGNDKSSVKAIESTPSKSTVPMLSPSFDFKWSRPETDLSSEARRIMESVREEAAKIKEKMLSEREEQARKDEEADQVISASGRKFAVPRSKASRFSDAHKAEFQKMDSIANHVSTWKNKLQPEQRSLKRTKSRANLDSEAPSAKRTQSSIPQESRTPGKRNKTHFHDDVSTVRPISSEGPTESPTRLQKRLPTAITTPTKSSIARAASVKTLHSTKIPALNRSKSAMKLTSASPPKTEGSNKYFSALARAGSMKSIMHRSQPKFSDDPIKIAAGTHLPVPKQDLKASSALASQAGSLYPLIRSPTLKRVGFNFNSKDEPKAPVISSPSPLRTFASPTKHIAAGPPTVEKDAVIYPALKTPGEGPLSSHPPAPGDFTFRSTKPVQFGPSTSGLTSPTIRRVRPSGIATPVSALAGLPAVPHGMPNKKRRRVDDDTEDDDDDDVENRAPSHRATGESPAKRVKPSEIKKLDTLTIGATARRRLGAAATKVKGFGAKDKKPVLSLSRLNMLARPKERR